MIFVAALSLTVVTRKWIILTFIHRHVEIIWKKYLSKRQGNSLCSTLNKRLIFVDLLEIHTARLDKLHFVRANAYDWIETKTMRIDHEENKKYL